MEFIRAAALIVATILVGMMAGVFALYSNTIMPGLKRTDDRTFVAAFQAIDTRIINPAFLASFMGALVFTGASTVLHLGEDFRPGLWWILIALVLYSAVVAATLAVNVPLNDDIKAAGDADEIADLTAVRQRFNEVRWLASNHFRTVATTVAFACLCWALVLLGRA